mmetsp:Transcript_34833/g.92032  ORF Transcript_34833/g.92032 Transcript_34833/m.92032 type:complete len:246 (-) Transcript_34833:867-1604(-)
MTSNHRASLGMVPTMKAQINSPRLHRLGMRTGDLLMAAGSQGVPAGQDKAAAVAVVAVQIAAAPMEVARMIRARAGVAEAAAAQVVIAQVAAALLAAALLAVAPQKVKMNAVVQSTAEAVAMPSVVAVTAVVVAEVAAGVSVDEVTDRHHIHAADRSVEVHHPTADGAAQCRPRGGKPATARQSHAISSKRRISSSSSSSVVVVESGSGQGREAEHPMPVAETAQVNHHHRSLCTTAAQQLQQLP